MFQPGIVVRHPACCHSFRLGSLGPGGWDSNQNMLLGRAWCWGNKTRKSSDVQVNTSGIPMRLEGAWSWEASVRARALSRGLAGPDCRAASALAPWGRGAMPDMSSLRWVTMTEMAWIVLPMPCRHASPSRARDLLAALGDL